MCSAGCSQLRGKKNAVSDQRSQPSSAGRTEGRCRGPLAPVVNLASWPYSSELLASPSPFDKDGVDDASLHDAERVESLVGGESGQVRPPR